MEWYIIGSLIVLLLIVLFVKNKNKAIMLLTGHIMTTLKSQEAFIVQGVYNIIPKDIKQVVSSQHIAMIISYAIMMIGRLLKNEDTE
ncbi:hypothetical protein ABE073_03750 [Lederbergia citrisecunda]|uniref:hypothetical protein n=1 Tax=Lederbergia citrisecunda TaxID=2833583 RepID=UPI003D29B03A